MNRRDLLRGAALTAATALSQRGQAAPPQRLSTPGQLPLPEWAKTGNFTFMGLDGGPLEAEKGLRSGWEYFTPEDSNGVVKAVRDFYRPENVEIPKTAGVNCVYVTWTNGWSKPREQQDQWPLASRYMDECRRNGIHTMVYLSAANMFWEDYIARTPESRKWIETGESGYIRHYGGRLERVMANLKLPAWRQELKTSVDAALAAGAEGFWVDNLFWWHGLDLFKDVLKELQEHAARRKPNLVWHTNLNAGAYNWTRVGNVVGCEDGHAPKFDPSADPPASGNMGLASFLSGLTEGWRSAITEDYGKGLSGPERQLIIAECWMWGVTSSYFPVDRLRQAAWHNRDPKEWKVLEAMGVFNRHQLAHPGLFARGDSVATVGIVGHGGSVGTDLAKQKATMQGQGDMVRLLDMLGAWNVQYDVLFEDRLQPEILRKYAVIVVAYPDQMPEGARESLESFAKSGGTIISPESARFGVTPVSLPASAFSLKGSPRQLRDAIVKRQGPQAVEVDAPAGVIYRAVRQPGRVVVHLVNYKLKPDAPFAVRYRGRANKVETLTPGEPGPRNVTARSADPWTSVTVPGFPVQSLVIFQV